MAEENPRKDQEPEDSESAELISTPPGKRAYSNVRRELSDKELESTAVQRLLINNLDELSEKNTELEKFKEKYYDADKERAVLKEKLDRRNFSDFFMFLLPSIAGLLFGFVPVFWEKKFAGIVFLSIGLLLIIFCVAYFLLTRFKKK